MSIFRAFVDRLSGTRASVSTSPPGGGGAGFASFVRAATPTEIKRTGAEVRVRGWEQHAVVMACARVITDLVATVPLVAVGRANRSGERIPLPSTHPLARLLERPAPRTTARTLRGQFALDFTIYGNALWLIDRTVPGSLALRRINPEGLQIVNVDSDGDPVSYEWTDSIGVVRRAPAEDVLHFRDLDLSPAGRPDVFGYPRAASALTAIAADNESSSYVRQVVGNDGAPPFVALMHDEATTEDARAMQEAYLERQVKRGRRGVPQFMGGVRDVKPLGFTLSDLEFPDLRRIAREDICAAFGVDPRMIGVGSAASDAGMSGTQYVEARARLIAHTVEPILSVCEEELSTWLAPEFGDVAVQYDRDALRELAEDDATTSTRVREEWRASLRSWEEARAALRLPAELPLTESFLMPSLATIVPGAALVVDPRDLDEPEPEPPAAPPPAPAPEPPPESPAEPEGEEPEEPGDDEGPETEARSGARGRFLTRSDRLAYWQRYDAAARRDEEAYRTEAMARFRAEAKDVRKILAGDGRADAVNPDPFVREALRRIRANYRPGGDYHRAWVEAYRALIGRTFGVGGEDVAAQFGLSFNLESPTVQAAIEARAVRLATLVGETSSRQITAAVFAGEKAGLGIDAIARLVEATVFNAAATGRAEMIARTETIGALSQGGYEQARESGVIASKEWLATMDDRTRDDHALIDGARIPLNDDFPIGVRFPGDQLGAADQVINCRCTLLYSDEPAPPRGGIS